MFNNVNDGSIAVLGIAIALAIFCSTEKYCDTQLEIAKIKAETHEKTLEE